MSDQLCREYPLALVCRVLETPRSRVYVRSRAAGAQAADGELHAHIERIAGHWPTYGYRRVTTQLRRERDEGAAAVTGKRVRRLMHELGLVGRTPQRRCRTTNSDHPDARSPNLVADLAITQPDAVWVADITSVPLQRDVVSLAVLMDVCTRAIRGGELSRHLDQALTLAALERAVTTGHQPGIHHSDQGMQYAATADVACLEQLGTRISMAEQGNRARMAMLSD